LIDIIQNILWPEHLDKLNEIFGTARRHQCHNAMENLIDGVRDVQRVFIGNKEETIHAIVELHQTNNNQWADYVEPYSKSCDY
jgi:hypothetical protein